jgi:hypothetical protein
MTDIVGRDRTPIRSLGAESAIIAYMTRIDAHGRTIVIVVYDGVTLLDAVGPAEVFAEANRFGARYRLLFASVGGNDVSTSLGVRFAVSTGLADVQSADTVLVADGENLATVKVRYDCPGVIALDCAGRDVRERQRPAPRRHRRPRPPP